MTPLQRNILLSTARYHFMTNTIIKMLRLSHNYDSIRKATRLLCQHPSKSPFLLKVGGYLREENLYALSASGAREVAEWTGTQVGKIPHFKNSPAKRIKLDLFHRRACIAFRVLLDRAIARKSPKKWRVLQYSNYFEYEGANHRKHHRNPRYSKIRFQFPGSEDIIIPDAVFLVEEISTKQKTLFTLECVCGQNKGRTITQVRNHMRSIRKRIIADAFGMFSTQDYVPLFWFQKPALMKAICEELVSNHKLSFAPFEQHFLFSTFGRTATCIQNKWVSASTQNTFVNFLSGASL